MLSHDRDNKIKYSKCREVSDHLQIRWYNSQRETITLNGPKAEEYKSLLEAKASILAITDTTESVDNELHETSQQQISVSEALNTTSVDPSLYKTIEAMKSEIDALKSQFNKHCFDSSKLHEESKTQKNIDPAFKTRKPIISIKTRLPRIRAITFE